MYWRFNEKLEKEQVVAKAERVVAGVRTRADGKGKVRKEMWAAFALEYERIFGEKRKNGRGKGTKTKKRRKYRFQTQFVGVVLPPEPGAEVEAAPAPAPAARTAEEDKFLSEMQRWSESG